MAITWRVETLSIDETGVVSLSIQEVVDLVPGKIYSVRKHKALGKVEFLKALKEMILEDRAKKASEDGIKAGIDLTNFETFLGA